MNNIDPSIIQIPWPKDSRAIFKELINSQDHGLDIAKEMRKRIHERALISPMVIFDKKLSNLVPLDKRFGALTTRCKVGAPKLPIPKLHIAPTWFGLLEYVRPKQMIITPRTQGKTTRLKMSLGSV